MKTVPVPDMVLTKIFQDACGTWQGDRAGGGGEEESEEDGPSATWDSVFGSNFGGRDDMEMMEAESNTMDLISEYEQYAESPGLEPLP